MALGALALVDQFAAGDPVVAGDRVAVRTEEDPDALGAAQVDDVAAEDVAGPPALVLLVGLETVLDRPGPAVPLDDVAVALRVDPRVVDAAAGELRAVEDVRDEPPAGRALLDVHRLRGGGDPVRGDEVG